jgi:predicted anti-sigma-YlaC factor YlaD
MTEHLANQTLIDYMHAGLGPEQDAHVYAHIESCAACRSDYDAELALSDMLRTYATRETRELPSSVKAEIWERIRAARPSPLRNLADWLRPAVTLPVAAALALGIYFGTSYLGPHGIAPIDAAYYLQDHAALNSMVPFSDRVAVAAAYTADANP